MVELTIRLHMMGGKRRDVPPRMPGLSALLVAFAGRLCRSAQPGTSRLDAESIREPLAPLPVPSGCLGGIRLSFPPFFDPCGGPGLSLGHSLLHFPPRAGSPRLRCSACADPAGPVPFR